MQLWFVVAILLEFWWINVLMMVILVDDNWHLLYREKHIGNIFKIHWVVIVVSSVSLLQFSFVPSLKQHFVIAY